MVGDTETGFLDFERAGSERDLSKVRCAIAREECQEEDPYALTSFG